MPTIPVTQTIHVGCAGWSIPRDLVDHFPAEGTHLNRYAARLPAAEINTSFYRPHRPTTYQRWAESVPASFRFSVKIPKSMTHDQRLEIEPETLQTFLDEVSGLGARLGCLLLQLPPSLKFDDAVALRFFTMLRELTSVGVACECRHASWFELDAQRLLQHFDIARVAADPACVPAAGVPSEWSHLVYYRLHGSPRMYYSDYSSDYLADIAGKLNAAHAAGRDCWCIFDNTAAGAATRNALDVYRLTQTESP